MTPDQSTNVLNATFTDNTINGSMKATKIEVSTPSVFLDSVYVTCNDGSITVTCGKMSGTCQSMTVTLVLPASTSDITSVEFDVLAARIGSLDELPTTDKSSIVAAINEQSDQIGDLANLTTTAKTSAVAAINEVNAQSVKLYTPPTQTIAFSNESLKTLPLSTLIANSPIASVSQIVSIWCYELYGATPLWACYTGGTGSIYVLSNTARTLTAYIVFKI